MKTEDGVSPMVSAASVAFTMIVFTLLYGLLAVIELKLMLRAIKVGPEKLTEYDNTTFDEVELGGDPDRTLTMAY